ncbi:MAG: hypothetical protein H7Y30_17600, partial [Pyrinomonadaceae bacterium]|nr:hypothetical protein [Pyrinomonadaceae bacterium]
MFRSCPKLALRLPFSLLTAALCLLIAAGWMMPLRAQAISSFDRERFR